jgi:heterodisulfide reductase subunit A-like polyferredoxin
MRTPGQAEDLYRKAQEAGVTFIRCQDPEVQASDDKLAVEAEDWFRRQQWGRISHRKKKRKRKKARKRRRR